MEHLLSLQWPANWHSAQSNAWYEVDLATSKTGSVWSSPHCLFVLDLLCEGGGCQWEGESAKRHLPLHRRRLWRIHRLNSYPQMKMPNQYQHSQDTYRQPVQGNAVQCDPVSRITDTRCAGVPTYMNA